MLLNQIFIFWLVKFINNKKNYPGTLDVCTLYDPKKKKKQQQQQQYKKKQS